MLPATQRSLQRDSIEKKVDAVLAETGFIDIDPVKVQGNARAILNANGRTLDSVLGNLAYLSDCAENEMVRLNATRDCLTIHGVNLKPDTGESKQSINIVFQNVVNGEEKLKAIFCPNRTQEV